MVSNQWYGNVSAMYQQPNPNSWNQQHWNPGNNQQHQQPPMGAQQRGQPQQQPQQGSNQGQSQDYTKQWEAYWNQMNRMHDPHSQQSPYNQHAQVRPSI